MARKLLGDRIRAALSSVGITPERVEALIGECNCEQRRQWANEIDLAVRRGLRRLFGGADREAVRVEVEAEIEKRIQDAKDNPPPKTVQLKR